MATSGVMADFGRLPPQRKVAVFGVIGLVIGLLYWQFFYKSLSSDLTDAEDSNQSLAAMDTKLANDIPRYEEAKTNMARLKRIIEENQKALPTEAEVPAFFETLENKVKLAGVEINKWNKRNEEPVEQFVKVPVEIEITGTFMQLKRFFASLVQKDIVPLAPSVEGDPDRERIISIESLALSQPTVKNREIILTARFVAVTFRQEDKAPPAPGAAPAPPAATPPKPTGAAPPMPSAATPAGAKARVEESLKKGDAIDRNATGADEAKTPAGSGSARLKGGI
jgi:type IV pilus assembly protein PilO